MEEWVVTFRISPQDHPNWGLAEFFRGTEAQCKYIQDNFAGGECDLIQTKPWQIAIGPVDAWYDFLQQFECDDRGYVTRDDARSGCTQRRT